MEIEKIRGACGEDIDSKDFVDQIRRHNPGTVTLTADSEFIVTDTRNGRKYYPKGVYWHKKNLIVVGAYKAPADMKDKLKSYPLRLALPAESVTVEVTRGGSSC
jgi:hypothetical protein